MNITNSLHFVNKAINEAERLKKQSISQMQYQNYMVVRDDNNYVVQMFSNAACDKAIKNGNLLYLTR
jgi:hypothetical protein